MVARSVLATALIGLELLGVGGSRAAAADDAGALQVVASIKPVHALVAGVMAGVAEPQLLIEGVASPHSYALRPSQARTLEHADVVFWVGEELESFLVKPLATLSDDAVIVALGEAEGLHTLATREGGLRAEDEGHDGHDHDALPGHVDMHVWLDPRATLWRWWLRSPKH